MELSSLLTLASFIASILVTWGMITTKVNRLETDLKEISALVRLLEQAGNVRQLDIERRMNGLNDSFVTLEHFRETMSQFRADYKELKDDIKQVLRLLNDPTRSV